MTNAVDDQAYRRPKQHHVQPIRDQAVAVEHTGWIHIRDKVTRDLVWNIRWTIWRAAQQETK